MKGRPIVFLIAAAITAVRPVQFATAEESGFATAESSAELAKKLSNPVA